MPDSQGQEASKKSTLDEKALRPISETITKIKSIQNRIERVCIRSRYEIGKVLIRDWEQIETAKQKCITHKLEFWETLAKQVNLHSRILRDCLRFAEQYEARDVARLLESGATWSHVVQLLKVRTQEKREEFLTRIGKDGLTAAALEKEIMAKDEDDQHHSGGKNRQQHRSLSLKKGIEQAIKRANGIKTEFQSVLFSDEFDVATKVLNTSPDDITAETQKGIQELISECRDLLAILPDILDRLEKDSLPWILQVLESRERNGQLAASP